MMTLVVALLYLGERAIQVCVMRKERYTEVVVSREWTHPTQVVAVHVHNWIYVMPHRCSVQL